MSQCKRSRDIRGLRLGSDWDQHSDRDKSYSDETDSPRKRTLPTPHLRNPECCKSAPTPPVGHILTHLLGSGSSGKIVINRAARRCPLRQSRRAIPRQTRAAGSDGRLALDRIPRFFFFRRLSPFKFAGLPVVVGATALDHFVAEPIARHDECNEVAAAKAKRAERPHNAEL